MKQILLLAAGACLFVAGVARAQESSGPAFNPANAARLEQSKQSLVMALESSSPGLQATAAQTVRELKSLVPDDPFTCMIIPLMRIVKDEDAAVEARILAALALHELNSEKGDFAIKGEAKHSGVSRFKYICAALTAERAKQVQLARQLETPSLPAVAESR